MTIEEASVNINNPDLITAIKSAIVCTNTKDTYSSGFRNGLRYVIALLTDEEPKYEDAKTGHWVSVNDEDNVAIDNDGFVERACYCSECQKYLIASDEYAVYGRYCPFCGTKMEGR